MASRNYTRLAVLDVLATLVVAVTLFLVVGPGLINPAGVRGDMTKTLQNMKHLHDATQRMAQDWQATTNMTSVGWPGDIGGTFQEWTTRLVKGGYVTTNELGECLSAPGVEVPSGVVPLTNNTALLVYAVKDDSPVEAVFLTTANYTNTLAGGVLNPKGKPYGDKRFLVMQRGGYGAVLKAEQAGDSNVVGSYVPLCR